MKKTDSFPKTRIQTLGVDPISLIESCFSKVQSGNLNTEETFLWLAQNILAKQLNHATTYLSTPCGNHTIETFSIRFFMANRKLSRDHGLAVTFTFEPQEGLPAVSDLRQCFLPLKIVQPRV